MWAPRRLDLALFAGATTTAGVLVLVGDEGWAEWVFGSFMFFCLALLGRLGVEAWRSARTERLRARELQATPPAEVAREAVERERQRLATEVETCIRDSLRQIAEEVAQLDEARPVPGLQHVHALTRRTTSELRRQLGLLRDEVAEQPSEAAVGQAVVPATRRDRALAEGLAMATLGGVESTVYLLSVGPRSLLPWTAVLTALAASTLAGRRWQPSAALMAFAGLVAAGSLVGHPVTSGFWIVVTLGVLVWTLAAGAWRSTRALLLSISTGLVVLGVVTWAFRRDDPDNLGVLVLVFAVAAVAGTVVAAQRQRQARAQAAARARERLLGDTASEAVRAERVLVARELHDVVSHAVGVIALQAAAAELSWPRDLDAVHRAIEVIRRTTTETLADLERLSPPTGVEGGHTLDDLLALVDRVRAAGTRVDLTVVGDDSPHADVVHRLVQECLTNAMRHAPGAPVSVRVSTGMDSTEVSVTDDGPGPRETQRPGYGLVGLAERVEFAGGSLETGTGPHGRGFRVSASMPHVSRVGAG